MAPLRKANRDRAKQSGCDDTPQCEAMLDTKNTIQTRAESPIVESSTPSTPISSEEPPSISTPAKVTNNESRKDGLPREGTPLSDLQFLMASLNLTPGRTIGPGFLELRSMHNNSTPPPIPPRKKLVPRSISARLHPKPPSSEEARTNHVARHGSKGSHIQQQGTPVVVRNWTSTEYLLSARVQALRM